MRTLLCLSSALLLSTAFSEAQLEPVAGTFSVEDVIPVPIQLTVAREAPIYYQSSMDRVLGAMAPGTAVRLVAMSDKGEFRVRGRARHGDVAGWMRRSDLISKDPNLASNLKKAWDRYAQVNDLIAAKQVAMGMTMEEVQASIGKPDRKRSKVSSAGREDTYEYIVYEMVPQVGISRNAFGELVETVTYLRVETGRLSVTFADGVASELEEVTGNPLGRGGVRMVPGPIRFW